LSRNYASDLTRGIERGNPCRHATLRCDNGHQKKEPIRGSWQRKRSQRAASTRLGKDAQPNECMNRSPAHTFECRPPVGACQRPLSWERLSKRADENSHWNRLRGGQVGKVVTTRRTLFWFGFCPQRFGQLWYGSNESMPVPDKLCRITRV
jgi:hypothetical protein